MAYYAKLDANNVVIDVVSVDNSDIVDDEGNEVESLGSDLLKGIFGSDTVWVKTSYNNNIRKNFAGIDFTYDYTRDAFIPPKDFPSWVLNETTCQWEAPVSKPSGMHYWDEDAYQADNTQGWVAF